MIQNRIEKLKFILEEMQIALYLTTHLTDPFVTRTLARHILIRAENFITHARRLQRPLKEAGHDTRELHKTKENYASAFDEYFKDARHRLGAHVQDFDLGKRIELWNDIEIIKISFFVDGAKEIYQSISPFNLHGYVTYVDPPEINDSDILESLQKHQKLIESRNWVEVGCDPLAMTRNNTTALLNMTPVHSRAGQLTLIRRWISIQVDILSRISAHTRILRILKARIITDIVSFCDCLVTRPVASGALQEMDGLDKLIIDSSESPAPIVNFISI